MGITKKILNIFTGIFLFTIVLAYSFSKYYISELVLSATIYVLFLCVFIILVYIILLLFTKQRIQKTVLAFFILLLGLTIFLYSGKIKKFTEGSEGISNNIHTTGSGLSMLYSNILRNNKNTDIILEKITTINPDIIAFVEFSLYHKEKIYDILQKEYPYTNINKRSKTHAGNIIFSKYPITNLGEQTNQGTWRYNYIKILYKNQEYYFYIIHTSSPITPSTFKNRNQQLTLLAKEFQLQKKIRPQNSKTIMIGDFNTTPRSYYYQNFTNQIQLENYRSKRPFEYSWFIQSFSFVGVLIDHILVNENISLEKVDIIQFTGSDHKGFIIKGIK